MASILWLGCAAALAQPAESPLPVQAVAVTAAGPSSVLPPDLGRSFVFTDAINSPAAPGRFEAAGAIGGTPVFRAFNPQGSADYNGINVRWPNARAVKKGELLYARFAARAVQARQESGEAEGMFYFQRTDGQPAERSVQAFSVGPDWTLIHASFTALWDAAPGQAAAFISFGNLAQTLEIAGPELLAFDKQPRIADLPVTRFSYAGREPDAAWRQQALARIEALRTAALTVRVVDASGQPVAGAEISATMTRSAFTWGSSVSAERLLGTGSDDARYREEVLKLFDTTVIENAFKWPQWIVPGGPQRAMQALDWLRAHGKLVKGHNLAWPGWKFTPASIADDPQRGRRIEGQVEAHIRELTAATRGKLIGWDVVNEPLHETDYFKHMPVQTVATWFKLAGASDPALQLSINEYSMLNRSSSPLFIAQYLDFVRMLRGEGARVDVLGVQGHVGQTPRPPAAVLSDLDLLADKRPGNPRGNDVQVTEFDFNTADEALQADYTRDFLIALYSHPSVTGFIMWGFWQGEHWKPDAAMLRRDWSAKPSLRAWTDLVRGAWRTRASGRSDSAGELALRGHLGRYRVRAQSGARSIESDAELRPGGSVVELRLP